MPQLDEISVAIGRLQASIDGVAEGQSNHQIRDDAQHVVTQGLISELTKHVNHENEVMDKRIAHLEHRETQHQLLLKTLSWGAGVVGALISLTVLFLSGTWEHWFGKT